MRLTPVAICALCLLPGCRPNEEGQGSDASTDQSIVAHQTKATRVASTGVADVDVRQFLDVLGSESRQLSDSERETLWDLAHAPAEVRLKVLSSFLATSEDAARFNRRYQYITHACVGLDHGLRRRVAQDIIGQSAKKMPQDIQQRIAVLFLATELHLTAEIPELAINGLDLFLELAPRESRPNEWRTIKNNVRLWIDSLADGDVLRMTRRLERAVDNPEVEPVWRQATARTAARLIPVYLSDPADARSLEILTRGGAAGTRDADESTRAADRLLDIIEDQPETWLQAMLLSYIKKLPQGLSAAQAKRALNMTLPDFSKPNAHVTLRGVKDIVSNLSPEAVPAVLPELAASYGYAFAVRKSVRRVQNQMILPGRVGECIQAACEQADSQTAMSALEKYETAIEEFKSPDLSPYYVLVRKLPRDEALVFSKRLPTIKNFHMLALIARGLAESDVALNPQERMEQLRFLTQDVPKSFKQHSMLGVTRPLAAAFFATCQPIPRDQSSQAAQLLLKALPEARPLMIRVAMARGLAALAPLLTPAEAELAIDNVSLTARIRTVDASLGLPVLREIIDTRPDELSTHTMKLLRSAPRGGYGRLTPFVEKLVADVRERDVGALFRESLSQAIGDEQARPDATRATLFLSLMKQMADRLPQADRESIVRQIAEEAALVAQHNEPARRQLAQRVIEVVAHLPQHIPADAAQSLMETSLDLLEEPPKTGGTRIDVEMWLPAVANRVPLETAAGFRDRLRNVANRPRNERQESPDEQAFGQYNHDAIGTRLRIVEASLPLEVSEQEAGVLVRAIVQAPEPTLPRKLTQTVVSNNMAQLAVAAPILADKLSEDQLLLLLEGAIGLYANGGYVNADQLISTLTDALSAESALRVVNVITEMIREFPPTERTLGPGLKIACQRLRIVDLPGALDIVLAGEKLDGEARRTQPGLVELMRQRLAEMVVDHEEQIVAVLRSPQYSGQIRRLQWMLPITVRTVLQPDLQADDRLPLRDHLTHALERYREETEPGASLSPAIALLKQPECVGPIRQQLLAVLSQQMNEEFDKNIWRFLDKAVESGIPADELARPLK